MSRILTPDEMYEAAHFCLYANFALPIADYKFSFLIFPFIYVQKCKKSETLNHAILAAIEISSLDN